MQRKTVSKEVATCSQIKALAKELSLQPLKKAMSRNAVATNHSGRDLKKAEQKKLMSRHVIEVATWKIVGKKEISCNVEPRLQPEEKKWKAEEVATSP